MSITNAVKNFLATHTVSFETAPIDVASTYDAHRWLRSAFFKDESGTVLVIVPNYDFLDIETLRRASGRNLVPVFAEELRSDVPNHEDSDSVPLGAFYGIPTIVHNRVPSDGTVLFNDRTRSAVVSMTAVDFIALQKDAVYLDISFPVTQEVVMQRFEDQRFTRKRIETLLENVEGLPAMPEMAQRILQVTGDPNAGAPDLAKVLEVDPSLAAQIISYATSAFYGYRGDITSVRDAISRVLGFELVANIALGIAIGTTFRVPADGPIGLSAFWRHAVYTSALVERLCKVVPRDRQASGGMAYLSGLLHDFGYLVLGHILPAAFSALNETIAANPTINVTTAEKLTLGITHTEIGKRLLQQWKIPDEAVVASEHHHDFEYTGDLAVYPQLIGLAEQLLHHHGVVSDADVADVPPNTLALLGLNEATIEKAAQPVIDACSDLDALAQLLSHAA